MVVASRKRPSAADVSESESLTDVSDSPSDFETPNNPSRKPVRKKAKITKAPTIPSKNEVMPKIPKEYQSDEGNPLFSVKWYKEVTKREGFWADFKKKVPKGVFTKRFKVEVSIEGDEESGKGGKSGGKTTAPISKAPQTTGVRKPARKPAETTSTADPLTDLGVTEDTLVASTEDVEDQKGEIKDSIVLGDDTKLGEEAPQLIQESTSAESVIPKENDDLISIALADPKLAPEQRARYIAIREQQQRTARVIEMQVEEENRLEKARVKREAAKDRKAAKEANAEAEGDDDELALETEGGIKKEKERKLFNPTRF